MVGAWVYFTLLTAVHVYANWRGVGCLALRTLNAQRAVLGSSSSGPRDTLVVVSLPPRRELGPREPEWSTGQGNHTCTELGLRSAAKRREPSLLSCLSSFPVHTRTEGSTLPAHLHRGHTLARRLLVV